MNRPRPNLAPTSPPARGDLPTGDLAPRPHPFGGEVSPETPTATTTNTPPPRPRGDVLIPTYTAHCFWGRCRFTETTLDPRATHAAMEQHYSTRHRADLDALLPKVVLR